METFHSSHHLIIFFIFLLSFITPFVQPQSTINIASRSYSTLNPVSNGVYTVSFSTSPSCRLTLGYINSTHYDELRYTLPFGYLPNSFNFINSAIGYLNPSNTFTFNSPSVSYYFVLYNQNTFQCSGIRFSAQLKITPLTTTSRTYTIPYGVTETYESSLSNSGGFTLAIRSAASSSSSFPFSISHYAQRYSSAPAITPSRSFYRSVLIYRSTSPTRITIPSSYSPGRWYVFINCNTLGGCPISVNTESTSDTSSAGAIVIGVVVGPIVFIIVLVFVVLVSVISVMIARKRRMLYMSTAAAASSSLSTTTTNYVPMVTMTQPTYIPIPTSTTTTTEKTTVYVPPPPPQVSQVPVQQPPYSNQPNTIVQGQQPYYNNPNYGNQAYYSTQPQYNQSAIQQQPQNYPNQSQTPVGYYSPGVGVYPTNPNVPLQEPMPAFNPNADQI